MTETSPTPWLQVVRHRGLFQQPSVLFLPEAVRVTFNLDHMTVMEQPVQNRTGHHRIPEDLSPLTKALIGRQDDRPPLGAAGDELEEHMGAVPIDGELAKLIDHEERGHGIELQAVLKAIVGIGFCQCGDEQSAEVNSVRCPCWTAFRPSPIAQWVFPVPGGPRNTIFSP